MKRLNKLIYFALACTFFVTSCELTETEEEKNNIDVTDYSDNKETEIKSEWSEEEIAKANTAANISSMSQMDKDIILFCNLARLNGRKFWETYASPNAYGSQSYINSLKIDLENATGLAMLVPEASLQKAAEYHANDMSENNFFDHTSCDGTSFTERVRSFYKGSAIAENISAGKTDALGVVIQLLIDDGITTLGHRKNILNANYTAIGVKSASHVQWRNVTVQDFGNKVIDKLE